MHFRIQGDELPGNVLDALGAVANKGRLRVKDVEYRPEEHLVMFLFRRFAIVGRSMLTGAVHSDCSTPCRVTIRKVTMCKMEDIGQCAEITMLFGIGYKDDEFFLSSAEESRGTTCYQLSCAVSGIDIEMKDE